MGVPRENVTKEPTKLPKLSRKWVVLPLFKPVARIKTTVRYTTENVHSMMVARLIPPTMTDAAPQSN